MFGMFEVAENRKAAQIALAKATLSKSFQSLFNVVKAPFPPAPTCRTPISTLAARRASPISRPPTKAARSSARWPRLWRSSGHRHAYKDVVNKFVHGQITSSEEAVTTLVKAIDEAR
jgi:glucose/mannose transport system substrate-binding protein